MASTVPAVKRQLRAYLATLPGLTETADKVVVRSAPVAPDEFADRQITLGGVIAPQVRAGLQRKQENATLTGWISITRPGADETAMNVVRDEAYGLLALVEAGLHEPAAGQAIPAADALTVASATLEEVPVDLDGTAGRRATIEFTITWIGFLT